MKEKLLDIGVVVFYFALGLVYLLIAAMAVYILYDFGTRAYQLFTDGTTVITTGDVKFMFAMVLIVSVEIIYGAVKRFVNWTKVFKEAFINYKADK